MTLPLSDPSKAPSSSSTGEEKELFRATLKGVSRSFYLTLRCLPGAVRRPMALGYLLARLSDTVADSAASPVEERLAILGSMEEVLEGGGDRAELMARLKGLRDAVEDKGEQRLLDQAEGVFQLYDRLEAMDRREVKWVLGVIISGQRLDLERFAKAGLEGRLVALQTGGELVDYTWRVAGCVGEFWTRVCFRHLSGYAELPEEEMVKLGVGLGRGLQMVNILRDAPADLRAGRCYLPLEELNELGEGGAERLLSDPASAREVVERWEQQCEEWLEMGRRYTEALRPWRLRLACFLPWALARRTLARMREERPLETARRVKVSRSEVRKIALRGLLVAFFPGAMRWAGRL